jgi:hypothetical protein
MFVYLKNVTEVFVYYKKVVFLHTLIKKRKIKVVASLYLSKESFKTKLLHNNKKDLS